MTLLGDTGYIWTNIWLKKFSEKYNIKNEEILSSKNRIKLNKFQ
jgi:hypothetical protein